MFRDALRSTINMATSYVNYYGFKGSKYSQRTHCPICAIERTGPAVNNQLLRRYPSYSPGIRAGPTILTWPMKQREKGKRVMKRVRPWRLGFLMEDP